MEGGGGGGSGSGGGLGGGGGGGGGGASEVLPLQKGGEEKVLATCTERFEVVLTRYL